MKTQINLAQLLQGGLAGLVAWLFKTVNELQQMAVVYQVQIDKLEQVVVDLALREKELNNDLT